MPDSLIEGLPKIVAQGKKEAQKILDGLSGRNRITLQTNELVLPTKAKAGLSLFTGQAVKELNKKDWQQLTGLRKSMNLNQKIE